MFCPNCGSQLDGGAKFCGNCGARLEASVPPSYQPAEPSFTPPPFDTPEPPRPIPWHSRGKLSPLHPGARRLSVAFVLALVAIQTVLFLLFTLMGDGVETGMLTAQLVGFVPTAALIVYLFCLDSIEKEPPGLLLKLFLIEGILTIVAVGPVELALEWVVSLFLEEDSLFFHIVDNLICVALVEEGFKYLVLKKFTWKHPAFNYRFDGIVYAAVTALGFAAFENFIYVSEYGFVTALTRLVSAVPGHCVDGILMGIFYGLAKQFDALGDVVKAKRYLFFSLLTPIAEHGFYDFFATFTDSVLLFYGYVFLLNAVVFVLVWRLAQKDEVIYAQQPQFATWQ
ncbi:MAG: PrsW family intramembrane metalloprotease [Clostridia bacterium]|nr:PrsW family intramembrane metalloprotease [Clostridia bacterium]